MSWELSSTQLRTMTPDDWDELVAAAKAEIRRRASAASWERWRQAPVSLVTGMETTVMRSERRAR